VHGPPVVLGDRGQRDRARGLGEPARGEQPEVVLDVLGADRVGGLVAGGAEAEEQRQLARVEPPRVGRALGAQHDQQQLVGRGRSVGGPARRRPPRLGALEQRVDRGPQLGRLARLEQLRPSAGRARQLDQPRPGAGVGLGARAHGLDVRGRRGRSRPVSQRPL
jgi:hypothetical protein